MDTLRGGFGGYSDSDGYDAAEDDFVGDALPPSIGQDERRLQVRAYNMWARLLGDRRFPIIADLEAGNLPDFDAWSVVLDFTSGIDNPAIRYLGSALAAESACDRTTISRLADVPGRSLLSRITDHYMQIIANEAPIGFEAEFVNQSGRTVLYRGILLPFSGSMASDRIDLVYGVINWKELADQQTTDELLLAIDQVLEHKAPREEQPLTEWADGPADRLSGTGFSGMGFTGLALSDPTDPDAALGADDALELSDSMMQAASLADSADSIGDILASARELALAAQGAEDRSHRALYAAIGRAHDFALAAVADPETFAEFVADAGLTVQARAPLLPVVKLVFGAHYDKTRLTEYAAVLAHAQGMGIEAGALAAHIAATPGGLKGVIRAARTQKNGRAGASKAPVAARMAARLRAMPATTLADLDPSGEEFTLVLARRTSAGAVEMLGEVPDAALIARAARTLLA